MKACILLGDRSDIAKGLEPFLIADGWRICGWNRTTAWEPSTEIPADWDMMLCCMGAVAPVGNWWEADELEFHNCIESNLLLPLRMLAQLWGRRRLGASVCFMAGSNPQKIMPGYLSYNLSKMALLKAVEQIDYESPDCKVFALGPGITNTKIHKPTLESGIRNERLERAMRDGNFTPIDDIYETLKWCVSQPKEICGGRNICVSDLKKYGPETLAEMLNRDGQLFKLRRVE